MSNFVEFDGKMTINAGVDMLKPVQNLILNLEKDNDYCDYILNVDPHYLHSEAETDTFKINGTANYNAVDGLLDLFESSGNTEKEFTDFISALAKAKAKIKFDVIAWNDTFNTLTRNQFIAVANISTNSLEVYGKNNMTCYVPSVRNLADFGLNDGDVIKIISDVDAKNYLSDDIFSAMKDEFDDPKMKRETAENMLLNYVQDVNHQGYILESELEDDWQLADSIHTWVKEHAINKKVI